MARALVTGAGGFVGANLVRALVARNDEVHACIQPGSKNWRLQGIEKALVIHEVDATRAEDTERAVLRSAPEIVFHLAQYGGNSGQDDTHLIRGTVIDGTALLYESCLRHGGVRAIVHAGTSSEYGKKDTPMSEEMCLEPSTEYAVAKVWATLYGQYMAKTMKLPVTTLRLFSVYGPYELGSRLIPAVILNAIGARNDLKLSNPKTARDFIYIDDVVRALLQAAEREASGEIFNIGSGNQTTNESVVAEVCKITGSSLSTSWGSLAGQSFDTTLWCADIRRAADVLQWKPSHDFHQGLIKTIGWMRNNAHLYV